MEIFYIFTPIVRVKKQMTNPSFYFNDTSPQGFIVYEMDIDSSQYSHEISGEGVALPMPFYSLGNSVMTVCQ